MRSRSKESSNKLWKILTTPSRRLTAADAGVTNPVKVISSQGEIPVPCSLRGELIGHNMDLIMKEGEKQKSIEAYAKFSGNRE